MRIDPVHSAVSQISADSTAQVAREQHAVAPEAQSPGDHATLSADQDSVSRLAKTAMQSPEIRQDKVESLRQAISSGQYELDPAKIAASIIDEHA